MNPASRLPLAAGCESTQPRVRPFHLLLLLRAEFEPRKSRSRQADGRSTTPINTRDFSLFVRLGFLRQTPGEKSRASEEICVEEEEVTSLTVCPKVIQIQLQQAWHHTQISVNNF